MSPKQRRACHALDQGELHPPTRGHQGALQELNQPGGFPPDSQVVQFYDGKCVLVTGASGFVGKLIIEKLLRTCGGIKKIYVLIRAKKSKSALERFEELFDSVIFDTLKGTKGRPQFGELKRKVVPLQGELTQPFLGLSIERLLQLADECSVILHAAAAVSFDGKLKRAIETNLLGTHNVLELGAKLPRLRALVHVSTCYSNCTTPGVINEHVYPVNASPTEMIRFAQTIDDETMDSLAPSFIDKHPNHYTYTKQLAEYLCAQCTAGPQQLPIIVCRPSIIVSTYQEPLKAYVDNRNAGNGMFDGVSRGLMRTINGNKTTVMDLVPADFVVNCTIALGWFCDLYHRVRLRVELPSAFSNPEDELVRIADKCLEERMLEYYRQRKLGLRVEAARLGLDEALLQLPVVHVSSSAENPITFNEMFKHIAEHSLEYPCRELFRKPQCTMLSNVVLSKLGAYMQHTLVGKLLDTIGPPPAQQCGKRSSTWAREFERVDKFNGVLPYFYLNSFKFCPDNRLKLLEVFMNDEDRRLFNCDVRQLDWYSFARDITLGIRRYLIGEPESTLPEARQKLTVTLYRNTLLQIISFALGSYLIMTLIVY